MISFDCKLVCCLYSKYIFSCSVFKINSYVLLPTHEYQVSVCCFLSVYFIISSHCLLWCAAYHTVGNVFLNFGKKSSQWAKLLCWTKLKAQGRLYDYCSLEWQCFPLFIIFTVFLAVNADDLNRCVVKTTTDRHAVQLWKYPVDKEVVTLRCM